MTEARMSNHRDSWDIPAEEDRLSLLDYPRIIIGLVAVGALITHFTFALCGLGGAR